ncbi:hypothetical protein CCDG5_1775 [[Clostridium] cellulosi]|uniref:DUF5343 domain-containing protein n=1 Tax=[Clostridium] cellulosi TaxID=29343 RepID=A0A078KUW4_9FIRM|nr:hypothetical protein CCDG5_1775 [[Clostridium] cellulosi]
MALTMSYLTSMKNVEAIFNSMLSARAPEKFTTRFLEDLGFKSSNDRLFIGVLKALGFIDSNGVPQQRYFDFLDQSQSKRVVAEGIKEAYEDLFNLRKDAQNMSNEEVKNKLKTLTQGQKGDRVIDSMALTFKTLCNYADWTETSPKSIPITNSENKPNDQGKMSTSTTYKSGSTSMELHYNIQIHLPETTNMAVYDAIFQSLKKHLM